MVAERATKHLSRLCWVGTFVCNCDVRNHLLDCWGGGCVYTPCILSTVSVVRVVLRHKYMSSGSTSNSRHVPCLFMSRVVAWIPSVHGLTWPGVPRDGDSLASANWRGMSLPQRFDCSMFINVLPEDAVDMEVSCDLVVSLSLQEPWVLEFLSPCLLSLL